MRTPVLTALAFLAVALPAAAGMSIKVDAEPGRDFSKFRTFAWADPTPGIAPVTHQRILAAVNKELTRKGLVLTDRDPDLLVGYDGSASEDIKPAEVMRSAGPGTFGGAGWFQVSEKSYLKGTLILSFADARGGKLVWRGTASDSIKDEPEKNVKKVDEAVRKLLAKFPPR